LLVAALVFALSARDNKKEAFSRRQTPVAPSTVARPLSANPQFPQPVNTPTSNVIDGALLGSPAPIQAQGAAATPAPNAPMPDFTSLGGIGAPVPAGALTSKQVNQMLNDRFGTQAPQYQDTKDLMPVPDMRYSASVDPTDPQSFMYDRTIFGRLKRRYGNQVDFFRGDLDIKPQQRGWFDLQPPTDVDVVNGYFANYLDIGQSTAIKDSTFSRNTPVEQLFEKTINPFGDIKGKTITANI
jgi:hypothetical protein